MPATKVGAIKQNPYKNLDEPVASSKEKTHGQCLVKQARLSHGYY